MFQTQHAEKALQRVPESLSFSNPAAAGLIRTRDRIVWLRWIKKPSFAFLRRCWKAAMQICANKI
jgi:hypothetical protein